MKYSIGKQDMKLTMSVYVSNRAITDELR